MIPYREILMSESDEKYHSATYNEEGIYLVEYCLILPPLFVLVNKRRDIVTLIGSYDNFKHLMVRI